MLHRRRFGEVEEDRPPEITFGEASALRVWLQSKTGQADIRFVTANMGGVTRLLEGLKDDIAGPEAHRRGSEWICGIIDFSNDHHLVNAMVQMRNECVRSLDGVFRHQGLQRYFLAFDIAAQAWWKLRFAKRSAAPPLFKSNMEVAANVVAKLGLGFVMDQAKTLLDASIQPLLDSPVGSVVTDKAQALGASAAQKALGKAAGGALVAELRKGQRADPDIILGSLPDLLVAGLRACLARKNGAPRTSLTGAPLRLLLIVDGADEPDRPALTARRAVTALSQLISGVMAIQDARVIVGSRGPLARVAAGLPNTTAPIGIRPFERDSILSCLAAAKCSPAIVASILDATAPHPGERAPAKPLSRAWVVREDLPPSPLSRDLNLVARKLGPGVADEQVVINAVHATLGAGQESMIMATLHAGDYLWLSRAAAGSWFVDDLVAPTSGYP